MRRLFNAPIRASMELSEQLVGTVVFFSLGYCAIKGAHISVDLFVMKFPKTAKASTISIMHFISTAMCAILTWQLLEYALNLSSTHTITVVLQWPTYPFAIMGAIGYAVLTVAFLIDFLKSLTRSTSDESR
jgi:TRAP-type C4-dicarboxylate transport system permease small subunit